MTNTTIFAQALADNRNYKNARIDGNSVGVSNARAWRKAIIALRYPAYKIRAYRHDSMGGNSIAEAVDMNPFYTALRVVIDLIGEIKGAKLHAQNLAEEIIAHSSRIRVIDITPEMAHARNVKREARKALTEDENEETLQAYEEACAEVERLEGEAGNCKKLFEIQTESAFIRAVEIALGDAVTGQMMKTVEEVMAEEEAKRQARRAKTAEKKKKKAKASK